MTWKPIIAGVDPTPEGVKAAQAAISLAFMGHTEAILVHAVRDPWIDMDFDPAPKDMRERSRLVLEAARAQMRKALAEHVPPAALDRMVVEYGRAPYVLAMQADEHAAELIVVGGKRHSLPGRWIAGSTAHYLVRAHDRPVLVLGPDANGPTLFSRILAAVDVSPAAELAIQAAGKFARLTKAELHAVHVVQPAPPLAGLPVALDVDMLMRAEQELERAVWPRLERFGAAHEVRRGPPAATILESARAWGADLVVLGSHGRGRIERLILGSVTEQILDHLPTSVLVVPVPDSAPGVGAIPSPAESRRARRTTRSTNRKQKRVRQ